MRNAHAIAATALSAIAGLGTVATAAEAQAPPYSPGQICGAGFSVIDQQDLNAGASKLGTIYLLYNASTGQNCAATVKTAAVGTPTRTTVGLWTQHEGRQHVDVGSYQYYAGSRKVDARHTCVQWGGSIDANGKTAAYESPYEHCS